MKNQLGQIFARKLYDHPIFVVGMGRSGTTVLLEALGRHPLIMTTPGEAILIYRLGELAYHFSERHSKKVYYENNLRVSRAYLYNTLRRLCFESIAGPNYGLRVFIKAFVKRKFSILNKQYWCAKTFPTCDQAKGLLQLYPIARFIYITRNGIDVVQSRTKFSGENFREYCEKWVENNERYRYMSKLECAMIVRYEQLVTNPVNFFQKIFDFIDLDYHNAPMDFVKSTLIHPLDRPTQVDVDVQTILKSREPSYQDWSQEKRELFKKICGQSMYEMGYEVPF